MMRLSRSAQVWYVEFIIAIVIVLAATTIFVTTIDIRPSGNQGVGNLQAEALRVSEQLLTSGQPSDWTAGDVVVPGILTDSWRIDDDSLAELYNMDPDQLRTVLGMRWPFRITMLTNGTIKDVAGSSHVGYDPSSTPTLVSVNRYVVYDGSISTLRVEVWR